ncbi:MAG: hypothetical protein ACPG5B_06330 [Chitinophagales bacterium]
MKTIHLCFCICMLLLLAQCKKTEEPTPTYHNFETCLNSDLSQAEGSIQISTTVVNHTAANQTNAKVKIHTNVAFEAFELSLKHNENEAFFATATSDSIGNITLNDLAAGKYTDVTLTLEDCVSEPFSFTIETAEPANVYINSPNSNICLGEATLVTASSDSEDTKYFAWNTGATTQSISISPSTTTNYSVTITDVTGTTNSTSLQVTVNSTNVNIGLNQTICLGDTTNIAATTTATNDISYQWSTGQTTQDISFTTTEIEIEMYSVTVTDENGCTASDEITVTVEDCEG